MANTPVKRRRLTWIVDLLLILIILLIGVTSACGNQPSTPEEILERFYHNERPEETLKDPLILGGDRVVPLVIERVKDKKMPRRRYAIAFLGNGSYAQALPVLQTILHDSSELDYFRTDALHSIYQIDAALGLKYAQSYTNESNDLGESSRDLLSEKRFVRARRTYLAAWVASFD